MHAHDEHFLVIGAVEDADAAALRQAAGGAPEKIVLQFLGAGMFEAEDLAALRIDAGHDVLDGAVLAGGIHGLENQEQRILVVGVKQALLLAQFFGVFDKLLLAVIIGFVKRLHLGRPLLEPDGCAFANPEILNFHADSLPKRGD